MDLVDVLSSSQLVNAGRLALSAVLLFASLNKLSDTAGFARVIRDLGLLPLRAVVPATVTIPALELALGGWLAYGGRGTNIAAVADGALFVAFAAAVAAVLRQGRHLECGCFGRFSRGRATRSTAGRNLAFAAVAIYVAVRFDVYSPHVATGLVAPLVVTAAVIGATVAAETASVVRQTRHVGSGTSRIAS